MQDFVALGEGTRPEDTGVEAVQEGVELEAGSPVYVCPDAAYGLDTISQVARK